ncbi:heavy metal translocating P-type ATPase metal-binding domain-containing protein [Sediminibacterium sp.]|uniref:heavy metal translocating P-type ATPase n=1 Tax=Sediminibacterium sp. TaxID=1917865 RepID=UPI0025F7500D|nr:heavy metal translocating P-type ATPase metal-binding domain-containing protein [Sediminibacterium sp.]
MLNKTIESTKCFHCGDACAGEPVVFDEKAFCCKGCSSVYQILNKSNLCEYYNIHDASGVKLPELQDQQKFGFLDNATIAADYIVFSKPNQIAVKFYLPQIHCSSCIWLLENLQKVNKGIYFSTVHFPTKEVTVYFNPDAITIRAIAELLASIGYEPYITLDDGQGAKRQDKMVSRRAMVKIGIAGFCFANIMMLSFPEYLGLETITVDGLTANLFRYVNLLLALPVLLYSGSEFFINSWFSVKQRRLNIDAPIALALAVTFGRSVYEIISGTGGGYLDSMSGIIFFMLLGRSFQTKTFADLSFNRDYKSYFPVAVCLIDKNGVESYIPVQDVQVDDTIRIRSNEVIPVDGMHLLGKSEIDYSFVTGENEPTSVAIGDLVYAGGKQLNGSIDLLVVKPFSQSNFTRLWNNDAFKKTDKNVYSFTTVISNYFSLAVLTVAFSSFAYWYPTSIANAWQAMTAVLIVACPCALLITATFTEGFVLNIFSKHGLFLKNAQVLQTIATIDQVVFDKTGTLTYPHASSVEYNGEPIAINHLQIIASMAGQSLHPLSKAIAHKINATPRYLEHIKEVAGAGIEAWENETHYKLGSASFVGNESAAPVASEVWVSIDNKILGKFIIQNILRAHVDRLIHELPYPVSVLSGDNNNAEHYLKQQLQRPIAYHFNQSPQAKLAYIESLQLSGKEVMMVGDGLNDAGALSKSNVGIAVVDNTIQFSPASDAIMLSDQLPLFDQYLKAAKWSKNLIKTTFVISTLYNAVGLYFSVTAQMSPLVAAILMPSSTFTIVISTMLGAALIEKFCFKNIADLKNIHQ